jgi:hypothetical protein
VTDDADEDDDWPRELRFLLERHPRAIWPLAGSPTVSFWLEVHDRLHLKAEEELVVPVLLEYVEH